MRPRSVVAVAFAASLASASIRFASSKSFAVSPPAECVVIETPTLFHDTLRSGWCPISSAGSTSLSTNSTEPTKSASSKVLTIVSPSRSQPSSSARRESISLSESSSTARSASVA